MSEILKLALIGLDTSHSIEFPKLMQAPETPADKRVKGLRAISCLSFETPFQGREGILKRKAQLEAWGVKVTDSFEEAVEGADAFLIEINDPSLHLEYFKRVAPLGKRIFLDKPMADSCANAKKIMEIAKAAGVDAMSCSSLRYMDALEKASSAIPSPERGAFFGPLGKAPSGSSIVWYGVHTAEMLVRCMGPGAQKVRTLPSADGVLLQVFYADGRHASAELVNNAYAYGGSLRKRNEAAVFSGPSDYVPLLGKIREFLLGGGTDATLEQAYEVMGVIDAAERSQLSGQEELILR